LVAALLGGDDLAADPVVDWLEDCVEDWAEG